MMEGIQPVRILMVEDDRQIADFVSRGLAQAGFTVDIARNGLDGLELATGGTHDVVILDITLPGMDGLELLRRIRSQETDVPILIVSGKSSVDDRVTGLQMGGDDYLSKPFAFAELLARIQSLLRRTRGSQGLVRLQVADLAIDLLSRRTFRGEQAIDLQPREFALLEYLMRNSGRVVTRTEILQRVWGYDFHPSTNVVEVHVCRLRAKVEAPGKPKLLKTIRGVGYALSDDTQMS
jgi:two-component system, OmpR family, response regulator